VKRARARSSATVLTLLFACALLSPAGAAAISGGEIVQRLSQQREANGLPGGLIEQPDWSAACAKHNSYEARTGEFGHSEDPSSPYYSAEGDWAAHNSVLAWGSLSWADGNPWEQAPIHLIQMLAPALSEMGAAENDDRNCATTWPGYKRPDPGSLTAYSYPGDGVTGVVPTERAGESPFVPGDFVGLPAGTATGRYLLAYLAGVSASNASEVTATASLSNAAGPVELRVIDSANPQVGPYMPRPSAFLIPVQPLQPLTGYEAVVHWAVGGAPLTEQHFSFKTGTDPTSSDAATDDKQQAGTCHRYARRARILRSRASAVRRHATRLAHASGSKARSRSRELMTFSVQLKRQARREAKQAKRCSSK
jgi:hypothetical protein